MFAPGVRFEGWDAVAYARLTSLFRQDPPPSREGLGGVLVLSDGDRVLAAVHSARGVLNIGDAAPEAGALAAWVEQTDSRWGISVNPAGLDALRSQVRERLSSRSTTLDSWLALARVAHELTAQGIVGLWPSPHRTIAPPAAGVLGRTVGFVVPDGHCVALALFHAESIYTGCVIRSSKAGFDVVAGPKSFVETAGMLSGDWRRDYRLLNQAAEELYGPVALGCYAETNTLDRLADTSGARAWAAALAMREVIVSPAPAAFTLGLGVGAVRTALRDMADMGRRAAGSDIAADAIMAASDDARTFLLRAEI